jgi:hypothetical protein
LAGKWTIMTEDILDFPQLNTTNDRFMKYPPSCLLGFSRFNKCNEPFLSYLFVYSITVLLWDFIGAEGNHVSP